MENNEIQVNTTVTINKKQLLALRERTLVLIERYQSKLIEIDEQLALFPTE